MHIVIPNDWNDAFATSPNIEPLRRRATVVICKLPGVEQDKALRDADIVVGIRERTRFDAALLSRMPKLKLVAQVGGMENPHIDLAAATAKGTLVCHTSANRSQPSNAPGGMVELTIGMIIAALRQFPQQDRTIHAGGWPDPAGRVLDGKTLGIIGLGRIGLGVARAGQFFGMKAMAAGRTLTPERAASAGVEYTELETLFATSDVVSVHLKLNDATRGMITRGLLARMKPDAIFVNTSRGPIVDEVALADALEAGRIGGAALDVYDEEPLPADHRLRHCERALLLGHCGWATPEAYEHIVPSIIAVINAFLDGAPMNVVNPKALPMTSVTPTP